MAAAAAGGRCEPALQKRTAVKTAPNTRRDIREGIATFQETLAKNDGYHTRLDPPVHAEACQSGITKMVLYRPFVAVVYPAFRFF
jgi:hypothetical protein